MPKAPNLVRSKLLRITVSVQSQMLLEELSKRGVYGRNAAEVAARFIDEALQKMIDAPKLKVPNVAKKRRTK